MRFSMKRFLKLFLVVFLIYVIYLYLISYDLYSKLQLYPETFHKAYPVYPQEYPAQSSSETDENHLGVYPNPDNPLDDRILAQIRFVPESVKKLPTHVAQKTKLLLFYGGTPHPTGSLYFQTHPCAVKACTLTTDVTRVNKADVIVSNHVDVELSRSVERDPKQIWVLYFLESPVNAPLWGSGASLFNWTATYRRDSTLVTPYEKYVPVNASLLLRPPSRNYAAGKKKLVAWFVSNCYTSNQREQYAKELARHIEVDVYGTCGQFGCARGSAECSKKLNADYKFYLAFENSNCREYITEKFFINGLQHDVIPIVMGAPIEDYRRVSPPNSFIHVDSFKSPSELASYLHLLDKNDLLYNTYFQWKGLWKNIDTLFPCRLCSLAHDVDRRGKSWYVDLDAWWSGPGICTKSWGTSWSPEGKRYE